MCCIRRYPESEFCTLYLMLRLSFLASSSEHDIRSYAWRAIILSEKCRLIPLNNQFRVLGSHGYLFTGTMMVDGCIKMYCPRLPYTTTTIGASLLHSIPSFQRRDTSASWHRLEAHFHGYLVNMKLVHQSYRHWSHCWRRISFA